MLLIVWRIWSTWNQPIRSGKKDISSSLTVGPDWAQLTILPCNALIKSALFVPCARTPFAKNSLAIKSRFNEGQPELKGHAIPDKHILQGLPIRLKFCQSKNLSLNACNNKLTKRKDAIASYSHAELYLVRIPDWEWVGQPDWEISAYHISQLTTSSSRQLSTISWWL